MAKNIFYHKSFISIDQVSKLGIKLLFKTAVKMEKIVLKKKPSHILKGQVIAELFYQPSTRTFTSFLAAAEWLGALTIPIHEMATCSSAVKGESLADSVKTIEQTTAADAIIIRHPDDDSAEVASQAAKVPIINAGSGKKEHPTQALLDLYTIKKELGRTKNLKVIFLGDLKYGRTVKSLGKLLTLVDKNLKLFLVSPKILSLPNNLVKEWQNKGVKITITENLAKVLPVADVLYVTRVQKEWFAKENKLALYNKLKGAYDINLKILKLAKKKMIIMHPLPRVGEIAGEVDQDFRAVYFKQMSMVYISEWPYLN